MNPIEHIMQFFEFKHLPEHLQAVSRPCAELAQKMVASLPSNPELTVGLRRLLEAKDAFVRTALARPGALKGGGPSEPPAP